MCDYLDELIYCSDYLDYVDNDYIEKINSDDQYYSEAIKVKLQKTNFHNNTDIA